MRCQIQIQRGGSIYGLWWETVVSLAIPLSGFKSEVDALAYINRHMTDVPAARLRIVPMDKGVKLRDDRI